MKLARKLYLYFIGALVIVLSIFGFLSFRREARQLELDMGHHMGILGRAVAAAVTEAWRDSGQERAMAIIEDVNTGDFKIECSWVWLETVDGRPMVGQLNRQEYIGLYSGKSVARRGYRPDGTEAIYFYFPVSHLVRPGAVQLSEPLSFLKQQSLLNAIRLAVVGLILIVAIAILGAIAGQQLVG